ncbi:hypothetical protein DFQ27_007102 [Actinomortierella ambigua]|uniref:Uncharacterized protein n=1 Tax=Actinomortierella ambigua TaxID=1343610 RepID=A0A9P6PX54_9FUNG|nr:hypothetical protein DFQ27_007102 [Actinomortierella ambigua]
MAKVYDEEQSSLPTAVATTGPVTTGLSIKVKELLEREARLNETIDTNLRENIDRDPRAVWLLYAFQFFRGLTISLLIPIPAFIGNGEHRGVFMLAHSLLVGLLPLVGAMLADSYLGKWWTILVATVSLLAGAVSLTVVSATGAHTDAAVVVLYLSLVFTALGMGFAKPMIEALTGDQFLAVQERGIPRSFSLLYFAFSLGSMISQHVYRAFMYRYDRSSEGYLIYTPIVASCSALVLLPILLIGPRRFRTVLPMREFVPFKMVKTAVVAVRRFFSASPAERASMGHWLNFAAKDEGSLFVQEVHDFGLSMGHVLLPYFFLSALAMHVDYFQDSQMFTFNSTNSPFEFSNPLWGYDVHIYSVLTLLVFLTFVVYPLMERRGWNVSPHRRFGAASVCALLAFVLSEITDKIAKDAYTESLLRNLAPTESFTSDTLEDYRQPCPTCPNRWITFPQLFLLALHSALAVPAGIQIVYSETGRRLRTLAIVSWLLTEYLARITVQMRGTTYSVGYATMHATFSSLGVVGFVLFSVIMRYYTPRKGRTSINEAARQSREAEYSKL